jgi:sensor c-di-GMP phosphodiesterase-like protein
MPTLKKRYAIVLASTLILAAAGSFCGDILALRIGVWVYQARLDNYASQLAANSEYFGDEVRTALAAVDASPSSSCSDGEVKYLRALIFQSNSLKDAGQMRGDGQIECSADMGRVRHPWPQTKPDFVLPDGAAIYTKLTPYLDNNFVAVTVERGHSFVVLTPVARLNIQAPLHSTRTILGTPAKTDGGAKPGGPHPADPRILTTQGIYRENDNLYATHCSASDFICDTAYTSVSEVVAANRMRFRGCIALCGLIGACIGFISSMIYRRNKSPEQQLRRAIRRDQLRMVYQPIVDLASGRIEGAEALVRWTDEEGHAIGPDIFVRVAEREGFVGELTRLVVRHVLRELGPMLRSHPDFRVSINVASDDLADPGFPDFLATSLAQAGVVPQSLVIEITEGSTVGFAVATRAIHALRERGHSVHIDDFGTGYSSLSYLQNLAVDAIKIDQSFTRSIGTGSVTTAILPQILAMADALHLHVIVEGVETEQQAEYFAAPRQPVQAQGWLFGRPVPAEDFCRNLAGRERKPPVEEAVGGQQMANVA